MGERNETGVKRRLTFSEREGYRELPAPMQLEELSADLRRTVFDALVNQVAVWQQVSVVHGYVDGPGWRLVRRVLGQFYEVPEDDISNDVVKLKSTFREIVLGRKFYEVLDLLEAICEGSLDGTFAREIQRLFSLHGAAYRLDEAAGHWQFFPSSSEEQGHAVSTALGTLREAGMEGAHTHLTAAANDINARQFADAIRESIHAVESVARVLSPDAANGLRPALDSLMNSGVLKHRALKEGFLKLYGYTSNEQGIRHALLDSGAADVGLDEALFMFGACASFAAYLTAKHREIGLQGGE